MHAGREATLAEITKRYYWKRLPSDVARYVQQYIWCQRARAIVPVRQGKLRPTLPEHDGSVLAMDLVGPLPPTKDGHKYILTMFDPFSHYLVAKPISDKRATSVLEAFVTHILLEGRLPSRIALSDGSWVDRKGKVMLDNGSEFKNELFQHFFKKIEVRFGHTIPYHLQSNP